MKPAPFDYFRPTTLGAAIDALAGYDGTAQLVAGGQSLIAMMNLRLSTPEHLIDIRSLPELKACSEDERETCLGACVTHAAIEDGVVPDGSSGLLPKVASGIAYRAVRNRGTIGGSLALADPAADWPTTLIALDATVHLCGPAQKRSVKAADFVTGIYETGIRPNEILISVTIPKLSKSARWGYSKLARKSGSFPESIAAVVLDPDRSYARVVIGATDGTPVLLNVDLLNLPSTDLKETLEAARQAIDRCSDRSFDEYKSALHAATVARAIRQARA